jgi:hypothetical protein
MKPRVLFPPSLARFSEKNARVRLRAEFADSETMRGGVRLDGEEQTNLFVGPVDGLSLHPRIRPILGIAAHASLFEGRR